MLKKDKITLEVNFQHVQDHDQEFAGRILTEYYVLEKSLRRAVNDFVKSLNIAQESNVEV